jgi:hypothetical protein
MTSIDCRNAAWSLIGVELQSPRISPGQSGKEFLSLGDPNDAGAIHTDIGAVPRGPSAISLFIAQTHASMRHQPISRILSVASFARDSSVGMEKLNVSLSSFRAGDGVSREDMPDLIVVWRPPGLRHGGNYHCGAYQHRDQYAHVYSPWLDAASKFGRSARSDKRCHIDTRI